LEANQFIYYAKGFDGRYINGKTLRQLRPGSLLFMTGNTIHAGTKFMGQQQVLLQQLNKCWHATFPKYVKNVGDLKIFYDIQGRDNGRGRSVNPHGSGSFNTNSEQEWVYEEGNKYGKKAGYSSTRGDKDDGRLEVSISNDASGDGACLSYIEEI